MTRPSSPPSGIVFQYELNYNMASEYESCGAPKYQGMDPAPIKGPREDAVDKVDWSCECAEEMRSVRLQVVYMYSRVAKTLLDAFGPKRFQAVVEADLGCYTDNNWNSVFFDALDLMAAALCCQLSKPLEVDFTDAWCMLPMDDPFSHIREAFRLIIRFERMAQVEAFNQALTLLAPRVEATRGAAVLAWFRAQVAERKLSTRSAEAWLNNASANWTRETLGAGAGDRAGDAQRFMRRALGELVCRLPEHVPELPETLLLDRGRLQASFAEFEAIAAMLATAEAARDWVSVTHRTYNAVRFLHALDDLPAVGVTPAAYQGSVLDLMRCSLDIPGAAGGRRKMDSAGGVRISAEVEKRAEPLAEGPSSPYALVALDAEWYEHYRKVFRHLLMDALVRALHNHGCIDDWIQNRQITVIPGFMPRIAEWCKGVNHLVNSHLRVFMPLYEDLMVANLAVDTRKKPLSTLQWLRARFAGFCQWMRVV